MILIIYVKVKLIGEIVIVNNYLCKTLFKKTQYCILNPFLLEYIILVFKHSFILFTYANFLITKPRNCAQNAELITKISKFPVKSLLFALSVYQFVHNDCIFITFC